MSLRAAATSGSRGSRASAGPSARAVAGAGWRTAVLRAMACAVLAAVATGGGLSVAFGQQATRTPTASAPPPAAGAGGAGGTNDAPKVKVERGAGGKKVYRITEEIRIEGKIQKPEAFFFYQKSSINYDWLELKKDFVPRILDSVSRSPF